MTLPSVASLITGLLPSEHGIYANRGRLKVEHATLAARLKGAGFTNGAFIGNYALRPTRMLWQGFDRYTDTFREREQVREHPENDAPSLTGEAIAWLESLEEGTRFLLWIHYQEPHGPYTPPSFREAAAHGPTLPKAGSDSGRGAIPSYQWLGHGRLAEYQARYDGEVSVVDRQIGRLLDAFRERELLEHTVIAFTADHGEAFGEDDLYCAHGEGLSEALLHVPLLLFAPGLSPGTRSDRVRQIDVVPTLLSLLGLDAGALPGRTLLENDGDRPLVAQLVLREERWRSIRRGGFELIDDNDAPPQIRAAAGADAAPRAELLAELERLAPWPLRLSDLQQLTEEEETNLRAMGYAN
jgi:arylsulfatase